MRLTTGTWTPFSGSMQSAMKDALKLPWAGQQVAGIWMWSRGCIQIAERGALKEQ